MSIPSPTYMPTCPGAAAVPSAPGMKIRSPGRRSLTDATGVPASTCWYVVRGSDTPAAAQAICTSEEQSHQPDGSAPCGSPHDPPHWYGVPSADSAAATAVSPAAHRLPRSPAYFDAASESIVAARTRPRQQAPVRRLDRPGPAL